MQKLSAPNRQTFWIAKNVPALIVMSHVKIGDFLLLTPLLRRIADGFPFLTIAVPDILTELFSEEHIFERWIPAKDTSSFQYQFKEAIPILDLTYPLLDKAVPGHHLRLAKEPF